MEKKENFSRKRIAILKALQETDVHPTADWIYEKLKPQYPNLSLGTVYRNLKSFCATGRAVSVGVINGQEHFDGSLHAHAHLVCNKCGSVVDVQRDFFSDQELLKLSMENGLRFERAEVLFHGQCKACMASSEKKETA